MCGIIEVPTNPRMFFQSHFDTKIIKEFKRTERKIFYSQYFGNKEKRITDIAIEEIEIRLTKNDNFFRKNILTIIPKKVLHFEAL